MWAREYVGGVGGGVVWGEPFISGERFLIGG